ncbi:MAG: DUF6933 domain-containing protein [Nevskiales bacterium]
MTVLRCTAKLLKAMKARPVANPAPAQNRLGEWTANLIRIGRIQLVLAVNERTRLGLVIDAAPYAMISERFTQQVFKSLLWLGIEGDHAAAEAEATRPTQIAASNSRSVLATLNQFAWRAEVDIHYGKANSAAELSHRLADEIVCKPKHIGMPADRVREAFGLAPIDRRVRVPSDVILH